MIQTTADIIETIENDNMEQISLLLRDLIKTHRVGEGNTLRQLHKRYMLESVPIYDRKQSAYEKIDRRTASDFYGDIVDTKTGYMGNAVSIDLDREEYTNNGVLNESDFDADKDAMHNFFLDNASEDQNSSRTGSLTHTHKSHTNTHTHKHTHAHAHTLFSPAGFGRPSHPGVRATHST